ncbi:MAG TPA: rhodanese-like domain-containing protein [Kofleriaceae bacterium]|nr:rhodanese-like domain-containing protein [Kofleriaceae bacterium]
MAKIMLAAALALAACGKASDAPATARSAQAALPTMTVDQVDRAIASGACRAVDANADTTRRHEGVIPGAILLTDSDSYALSELPADKAKPLVFYCASSACPSSHHAAEKARLAGYTDVRVMPDGIAGWVTAGKKTQPI